MFKHPGNETAVIRFESERWYVCRRHREAPIGLGHLGDVAGTMGWVSVSLVPVRWTDQAV